MTRARLSRFVRVLVPALLFAAAARAQMIDAFTDVLPPNACLPNSGQPIVFVGEHCDGFYCPPDPLASCDLGSAEQTGLAGVLGGARMVRVLSHDGVTPIEAQLNDFAHLLSVRTAAGVGHELDLQYGGDGALAMNLDLTAYGPIGINLIVQGDVSASRPLHCNVSLWTMEAFPGGGTAQHGWIGTFVVDLTGVVSLPFSLFATANPKFSFADVDMVLIQASECVVGVPCETPPPVRSFSLGPIMFMSPGLPAVRATWGNLKARFR